MHHLFLLRPHGDATQQLERSHSHSHSPRKSYEIAITNSSFNRSLQTRDGVVNSFSNSVEVLSGADLNFTHFTFTTSNYLGANKLARSRTKCFAAIRSYSFLNTKSLGYINFKYPEDHGEDFNTPKAPITLTQVKNSLRQDALPIYIKATKDKSWLRS